MSPCLLDTSILEAIAEAPIDARLAAALEGQSDLLLAAHGLAQLTARIEARPDLAERARLAAWLGRLEALFAGRIIALDTALSARAGRLLALARAQGAEPEPLDAFTAAIAQAEGAFILARGAARFAPFGIAAADPWRPTGIVLANPEPQAAE